MSHNVRQFYQVFWKKNIIIDAILIGISFVIFFLSVIELLFLPKNDSLVLLYGVVGVCIGAGIHFVYLVVFAFIFLFRKKYSWSVLTIVHSTIVALFFILLISLAGFTLIKGLALSENRKTPLFLLT